ncbi:hypothetical protein [Pseudomonas sp. RW10S2]|uniref:hypothetical protein n=1 Tax=Pseudomonas sp. RW10S2 TaxID=459637 RepID=UPI001648FA47|nr:hypothetical protein [Pseudomonas sp. RW10S2]MBC3468208.1 hypothetical protein [Pseudomonas sp. RW10S2]
MSSNLMQTEPCSALPQVLVVGNVDGINYDPSFIYEAHVGPPLRMAACVLATRRFDVVVSTISADCYEGLALPALLLELKPQCLSSNLPVVICHEAQNPDFLEWHVRLAELVSVTVLRFALSSANVNLNIATALMTSAPNGEEY